MAAEPLAARAVAARREMAAAGAAAVLGHGRASVPEMSVK
jgi:hypothetical protein